MGKNINLKSGFQLQKTWNNLFIEFCIYSDIRKALILLMGHNIYFHNSSKYLSSKAFKIPT